MTHDKKTRKVFHKIHIKQIASNSGFAKISNLYNFENLKLNKKYFKNKICADLGCGSTGAGAYNLYRLGAKFVYLLDCLHNNSN